MPDEADYLVIAETDGSTVDGPTTPEPWEAERVILVDGVTIHEGPGWDTDTTPRRVLETAADAVVIGWLSTDELVAVIRAIRDG